MATVTISAVSYTTYISVADALVYLAASPRAASWVAASADARGQWLVEATRMINRQAWSGTPTQAYPSVQALAWPRDGVTGVTDGTTPQAILDACSELAATLIDDQSTLLATSAGKNVQRVDAGKGVGVTFFGPTSDTAGRFPTIVQELVGQYLATASATAGVPVAGGTSNESSFADCDDDFSFSGAP